MGEFFLGKLFEKFFFGKLKNTYTFLAFAWSRHQCHGHAGSIVFPQRRFSGLLQLLSAVECRALLFGSCVKIEAFEIHVLFLQLVYNLHFICVTIRMSSSSSIVLWMNLSCLRNCVPLKNFQRIFFLYKHLLYKHTQTQITKKLSTVLSTPPA